MAKIIEKIVQSKYPPKDSNVLWDDGENLKISRNGSFENVSDDTEIKNKLTELESTQGPYELSFTPNTCVNMSVGVGNVVAGVQPNNDGYNSILVECNEGDRFIVTGFAGYLRLWGFLDDNMVLLSVAENMTTEDGVSHVAPKGAKYFAANSKDGVVFANKKDSLNNKIVALEEEVDYKMAETKSEICTRPIPGNTYAIEPTKVESGKVYAEDGSTISVSGYNSNTYKLEVGKNAKITLQKDIPSSGLVAVAYKNSRGEFIPLVKSPFYVAESTNVFVTATKEVNEFIVVGGILEGIEANFEILTKEDFSVKKDALYGQKDSFPYAVSLQQGWFLDNPFRHNGEVKSVNIAMSGVSNSTIFILIAKKTVTDTLTTTSVTKCVVSTGENLLPDTIKFDKGDYIGFVPQDPIVASRQSGVTTYGCYSTTEPYITNPQVGLTATKNSLKINFDISYNVTYFLNADSVINKNLVNVGMSIWWMDGEPARAENTIDGEGTKVVGYQTLLQDIFNFESVTKYAYSGWSLGIGDDANVSIMNKVASSWAAQENAIWTLDTITNDHGRSVPLGTTADYDNNTGNGTFYGALRAFKDKVDSLSPNAIVICANSLYKRNTNANSLGLKIEDYGRAMCYAAAKNGWHFVDQYRYGGINEENEPYSLYDGLHPTNFGFRLAVKPWIEQFRILQATL